MSQKSRRLEVKFKIMGLDKRHTWKIDEVLYPSSLFWDNIEEDMGSYLKSLSEKEIKSISTERFKSDFNEYFNNIANRTLYKEIKEAEEIVTKVLWSQLTSEDKHDIFHDDVEFFSDWIDNCPKDLLNDYVKLLGEGKSLKDSIEKSLNYGDFFDAANLSPLAVNVNIKKGRLSLCSTSKSSLDKIKEMFEKQGHKLTAYSEETIDDDLTLYSCHFFIEP